MRNLNSIKLLRLCFFVLFLLITFPFNEANAQSGISYSISYDLLPYQEFSDPVIESVQGIDTNYFNNPQVQLRKLNTNLTYPIVFSGGRTVLINDFSYQLIEFKYRELSTPLKRLHSGSYTLMLQHRFNQKWSIWALSTPSLASDLEAEVSEDDFNYSAAIIFIKQFSDRLSIGLGAAYSTQFGSAAPLPVLAFDWNNGKNLMAKAILPVSLEFWYRYNKNLDLGLLLSGDGNNFRGDPVIYQVVNPELRYTMLTFGPAAKVNVYKNIFLNIEFGIIGLHRFEFYDGEIENASYDLKPKQYFRFGLKYGN